MDLNIKSGLTKDEIEAYIVFHAKGLQLRLWQLCQEFEDDPTIMDENTRLLEAIAVFDGIANHGLTVLIPEEIEVE